MKTLREMIDIVEGTVAENDETSWTANSAKFRQEDNMSWEVQVTLEPKDDINKGRGTQVKTMTVSSMSRDEAKQKLADYYRKNGWAVTDIKFTSDLDEEATSGEAQEYTVRVVDEEGSGYTVKVTATSEQGALHKAIVKVRNSGARPEHARIIRQDIEEEITPKAIEKVESLYKDNK